MSVSERYRWAVDILDVQRDDVILEIGCGYGHSISLISEKLGTGHLTAIDRSETMAAAASDANPQFINSGRVTVLHQDLLDRLLSAANFDKIFLFNINVFWMDPRDELAEIQRLLKPGGRFFLFHQPPPGHELAEFQSAFLRNLSGGRFTVTRTETSYAERICSLGLICEVGSFAQ